MLDSLPAPTLLIALITLALVGVVSRPWIVVGAIVATPIFFEIGSDGITHARSVLEPRDGIVFPLSVFVLPLLAHMAWQGASAIRSRVSDRWVTIAVLAFCSWSALALVWGVLTGRPDLLVWLQVLVPVYWFFVGRALMTAHELGDFVVSLIVTSTATALLLIISRLVIPPPAGVTDTRLGDEVVGGLVIYQAWDYLPLLLAASALIALAHLDLSDRGLALSSAGCVLCLVVFGLYSRGAVLTLLVGIGVLLVASHRWMARRRWVLMVAAALGIASVALVLSSLVGLTGPHRVLETVTTGLSLADESNRSRATAATVALGQIGDNPVFGRAMQPSETDPVTGRKKTVNTHNQYLDYAVRGGVPLAVAFIVIVLLALRRLWKRRGDGQMDRTWTGIAIALTAVVTTSNLLQVNFVQPMTAFPLWLIIGVASGRVAAQVTPRRRASKGGSRRRASSRSGQRKRARSEKVTIRAQEEPNR